MKQRAFWKLSMGHGDFNDILDVLEYLRQDVVVAHSRTHKLAFTQETQGEQFIHPDRDGDYFFLCHGNRTTTHPRRGIILVGQFSGPSFQIRHHKWTDDPGWAGRRFTWIKTAISSKKLAARYKQSWTPRFNSTFVQIPTKELRLFESVILKPYFALTLSKLGFGRSSVS